MSSWLSCFAACFSGDNGHPNKACEEASSRRGSRSSTAIVAGDWQTVPDDVLQAVLAYLPQDAAAAARLTCRHWHSTLSSYTQHLTIPTRYLCSKGARAGLRHAGCVFPSARRVTLFHADGWCDPVQARMDVEPLVRLESRLVSLEALAVGIPQITHVTIRDATYTRDPWSMSQLSWLKGLKGLTVSWDTALWAPGQVLQEGEALQPIFSLTNLTELILQKNAYLFLGEICFTDQTLAAAAAALRNLVRLDLSTIRVQDEGLSALGLLIHLTHLSLRGQINVTLGVLQTVFNSVTNLEELDLGVLVPSNDDLRRIAAAHAGLGSSSTAAAAGSSGRQRRSSRRRQQREALQQQMLQQQRHLSSVQIGGGGSSSAAAAAAGGGTWRSAFAATAAGSSSSSSFNRHNRPVAAAAAAAASSSSSSVSSDSSIRSISSSSSSGSSSSSRPRFSGADWTAVFAPLQRLRKLRLQSDLVLLGSCECLRNMASISHLELHGGAKFLSVGPYASLPPSWITNLADSDQPTPASAAAGSSAADLAAAAAASCARISANGAWPALKSLQIDNLQIVDDVITAVRQLINLQTLVISGPCLLVQQPLPAVLPDRRQQQQQGVAAAEQQQLKAVGRNPSIRQAHYNPNIPDGDQTNGSGSAALPGSSSSSSSSKDDKSTPTPLPIPQQQQQQQQQPASQVTLDSLRSLSGLSNSPQPQDFWHDGYPNSHTAAAAAAAGSSDQARSGSSSSSRSLLGLAARSNSSGSAAAAAADTDQIWRPAAAAAVGGDSILAHDADMLTRLSPLENLQCFHLHLPQNIPCGLSVTPFALAHLAPSWSQLTSIDLDVTAAAAAGSSTVAAAAAGGSSDLSGLLCGLAGYSSLKDLTLRMSDAADCGSSSSGSSSSSDGLGRQPKPGSCPSAWSNLPCSLVSLSLHDFSLSGQDLTHMGSATPCLRHFRLLHGHISSGTLWQITRAWPDLHSLIIKEPPLASIGSSGVAAVSGLSSLRVLGLTLEPHADVSSLGELSGLRYLLLDGRSNAELTGVKALRRLQNLKALVLPLLHIHHSDKQLLVSLQMALPNTVINNISCNFGHHRGYQWYKSFSLREREWWREPDDPWCWYPTLCITP